MTMKKALSTAFVLLLLLVTVSGALAEKNVLITVAGDCTIGGEGFNRKKEDSFFAFAEKYGYDYFFANFRDLFDNDDVTFVNLEGVLSDNEFLENKGKTYRFRGDTDYVKILTGSSVEGVSIANNHIVDFGEQGERNTRKTLDENGVKWCRNDKYFIVEKDGVRIGFFGLENSKIYTFRPEMGKMWKKLKEAGEVQAIVIYVHTGSEYVGEHREQTTKIMTNLIEMGADLVIISHPHVLQGIEVINNRMVFYSMGNFVFGGNSAIRYEKYGGNKEVTSLYSMVIQVNMTFSNDGQFLGQRTVIYPAYISDDPQVNHFQPKRLSPEEAEPVRAAIQRDTAFTLPELKADENGFAYMELPYTPATDGTMVPEE